MDEPTRRAMAEALGRAADLRHRIAITTGKIEHAARSTRDQSHASSTNATATASVADADENNYLQDVISTGVADLTSTNPQI